MSLRTALGLRYFGWFAACALLGACSSPGLYGYSRDYEPLDEEDELLDGTRELDPVMIERAPETWTKGRVSVFGVVKERKQGPGGASDLTLSMRTLATRNLCDSKDEQTCRVTVSSREHALVHAIVALKGEDDLGKKAVMPGSLVRVIGTLAQGVDAKDGTYVVQTQYLRHWPRDEYVTDAERDSMRQ
jgi:hypothetical protein